VPQGDPTKIHHKHQNKQKQPKPPKPSNKLANLMDIKGDDRGCQNHQHHQNKQKQPKPPKTTKSDRNRREW
jgi:hypothetical protein